MAWATFCNYRSVRDIGSRARLPSNSPVFKAEWWIIGELGDIVIKWHNHYLFYNKTACTSHGELIRTVTFYFESYHSVWTAGLHFALSISRNYSPPLKINILHHVLLWWFVLHFRNAKQLHNKSLEECTWGLFVMVINKWTLAIVDKQKTMDNPGRLSKRSEHDFSPFILLTHNPLETLQERWPTASTSWQLVARDKL